MEAAKGGKRNRDKAAIVIALPVPAYLLTSAYLVAMAVAVVIPTYLPTCLPAYLPAYLPACLRSSISNKASSNRPLPF